MNWIPIGLYLIFVSTAGLIMATDFDLFLSLIDKYGFPTAMCVAIAIYFSRQNTKLHRERSEFWIDNNRYLREMINELRASGGCKFTPGERKENA